MRWEEGEGKLERERDGMEGNGRGDVEERWKEEEGDGRYGKREIEMGSGR